MTHHHTLHLLPALSLLVKEKTWTLTSWTQVFGDDPDNDVVVDVVAVVPEMMILARMARRMLMRMMCSSD